MEFRISQGRDVQVKRFYAQSIMSGYIECARYAEGAKKNWDRFVKNLPQYFGGDWSKLKLYWKHLDEPPVESIGYLTPEGYHWTGYYVAIELESVKPAKPENEFCFSHYLVTMVVEKLDTNEIIHRLQDLDWINEAVDLEIG